MSEKTQKQMAQEVHQGMFGVADTEDRGMVGDIKEICEKLDAVNGKTRKNEVRSKVNQAVLFVLIGGSGVTAGITKLINLW